VGLLNLKNWLREAQSKRFSERQLAETALK
jgi:hypothetical protein